MSSAGAPPDLGVVFPQLEIGNDAEGIRSFARSVEALGYSHLIAYDHVLGADKNRDDARIDGWPALAYDHRDAFHEPLTLFAHLAAVAPRLRFATGILILPQRQTALVAKQVAEVSLLSGGRLRLGVGVGWNQFEYESLGIDFGERGRRLEEQIRVLRLLLTEELVDFHGEFHSLPRVGLKPLPAAVPPIWMGAKTPGGFRRLARHADGFIAAAPATNPEVRDWIGMLHEALFAAGRDPNAVGIEGRVELYGRSDQEVLEEVALWREFGATHLSAHTMVPLTRRSEPEPIEAHIERLTSLKEEVERHGN